MVVPPRARCPGRAPAVAGRDAEQLARLHGTRVLFAEVVSVEEREGVRFAGLDVGWSQMSEHFIYGALLDLVLCRAADAEPVRRVTISGNINEGNDLFAEDQPFPDVVEGDVLAPIGVGSYNASMWGKHCLRPPAGMVFFTDRT